MQPMRITAHMQDGRVAGSDPHFPLDSIIGAAWMRKHHPEAYYNASSHMLTNDFITPQLPFAKLGTGDLWYWACSFNQGEKQGEYVLHWHKRFDDQLEQYIDFGGKRGRINTTSAKYKAYRMPLVVQLFDKLVWYAVGDIDAVRELCQTITHIGKKSGQGLGAVDYWAVEPWTEDWSVQGPEGKLMRAVPLDHVPPNAAGQVRKYGIRPPYWHVDNQAVCALG